MILASPATAPLAGAVAFAPRPRLAAALGASLLAHAVLLGGLATGSGGGTALPAPRFAPEPLRATIVSAPARPTSVAVPAFVPAQPPPAPPSPALLPVPLPAPPPKAAPIAVPIAAEAGLVTITVDELAHPGEALAGRLAAAYPGAIRAPIAFDVVPQARYPEALRDERLQALVQVVVVVKEDGTLEIPEGFLEPSPFGDAVHDAVAGARAQPAQVDGAPRLAWNVLVLHFEAYGVAESLRTPHEERQGRR